MKLHLHPVTRRRLERFRKYRRAWWSFWILLSLYLISLCSELISNGRPYFVRLNGRTFFPILVNYSEDDFLGNGIKTRPDYRAIRTAHPDAVMRFSPLPCGPLDIAKPQMISIPDQVVVHFRPEPRVASCDVDRDLNVVRFVGEGDFTNVVIPKVSGLANAVAARFRNEPSRAYQGTAGTLQFSMPEYRPRSQPPRAVRVTVRELLASVSYEKVTLGRDLKWSSGLWGKASPDLRQKILDSAAARFGDRVETISAEINGYAYRVSFEKEEIRFPFRPTAGHPLGLDSSGRDVLARILYGFRTSISFGLVLVVAAMTVGTLVGGLQGYFGGRLDLFGQRVTEIWENLPFLYIIMLLGSVFGRSLALLLLCYALFNWISISYYMRGEFLKLRKLPFVEGAICLGLSSRHIMFRHILPNALVPIITFAPFSLIGAVSSLAALDFLGFGLPPPTPSWGEMLAQAQEFKWAWWLVVYPGLALFVVILLCVFIGEGVRAAFDPRRNTRLE